jgi:hypothetical protein
MIEVQTPYGRLKPQDIANLVQDWANECEAAKKEIARLEGELQMFTNTGCTVTPDNDISDGHHTFHELYHHRAVLFSVICSVFRDKAWKSWKHADGTMFDDFFIVGVTTPEGNYTYHYKKDCWDMFAVKELEFAPEWDGHQPKDVGRLLSLAADGRAS